MSIPQVDALWPVHGVSRWTTEVAQTTLATLWAVPDAPSKRRALRCSALRPLMLILSSGGGRRRVRAIRRDNPLLNRTRYRIPCVPGSFDLLRSAGHTRSYPAGRSHRHDLDWPRYPCARFRRLASDQRNSDGGPPPKFLV